MCLNRNKIWVFLPIYGTLYGKGRVIDFQCGNIRVMKNNGIAKIFINDKEILSTCCNSIFVNDGKVYLNTDNNPEYICHEQVVLPDRNKVTVYNGEVEYTAGSWVGEVKKNTRS